MNPPPARPSPLRSFVERAWKDEILPALREYVTIPNQSPAFDPDWEARGHMDRAVDLIAAWARERRIGGLDLEVVRLPGRTPLLLLEIPGTGEGTTLLYGHLDKQPPMQGWEEGLGPWTPVVRDGRLYGRGSADDGYAVFAALTAIEALESEGIRHPRSIVLIEGCEESGSYDLPAYIDLLASRIGTPELVVCLDSGCGNYEQLWVTTSLRGLIGGTLTVSTLVEGVHSGAAGGIVPSSFRIARRLLDRLEDSSSGRILLDELHAAIPDERREQAARAATLLGDSLCDAFPFHPGGKPRGADPTELLLNRTWRPALEVTGAEGLPAVRNAGNVLRPFTTLKLSIRLPPTVSHERAAEVVRRCLEHDPPGGARVSFAPEPGASGWNAPSLAPWLGDSIDRASREFFGREAGFIGEGGTIPFMAMLGQKFPNAQFVITGVLGPRSNAHGPNEFLHLQAATNLTGCVARILADQSLAVAPGSELAGRHSSRSSPVSCPRGSLHKSARNRRS